ncbi:MAG: ABC transporter ATP-binding protein [Oscillospiraceae bacterium]|nr:ABC transporter ATP-binding protein [Oscillospiraceae bacterium]
MSDHFEGIEFRHITKNFAGKAALSDVSLRIRKGTIHSIVGENGAGKSTLMNLLCGVHVPTSGEIFLDGEKADIRRPSDATALGIGMVHQHFMLVNVLNVWQNIILGSECTDRAGRLDMEEIREKVSAACREYGAQFNLDELVGNLTVGEQQRIEIIKVLFRRADYIVLDEPTAVLTPDEVDKLFGSIEHFRALGKTVIFISHKLEEVLRISDEITVLRRGESMGTLPRSEATADRLVEMMVGREIHTDGTPAQTQKGGSVLQLSGLCTRQESFGTALQGVDLELHGGEVLGVAGVDGNGQTELVKAIMGLMPVAEGRISIKGRDMTNRSTRRIRRMGVSCIPPDRQEQGLVLDSSIARNIVLGYEDLPAFRRGGLLSPAKVGQRAQELAEKYDIRNNGLGENVRSLSGGNQQKAILARECGLVDPDIIVAVNPTRGLDIGAIEYVYNKLEELKKEGKSILLISTELPEVLRLSDRVAVMYKGRIMDIVSDAQNNIARIGRMMMGIREDGHESE